EPLFMIIGNKNDLANIKKIDDKKGRELKEEINALSFITTSAKTGSNVERAFMDLVHMLLEGAGEPMP
ncbi:hypothetical protein GF325_10315, partial [Candidatus Bathyarchaeota archaeon]|nr:hypothetical protein [Candidatus Bathyarchaeota archaeon]